MSGIWVVVEMVGSGYMRVGDGGGCVCGGYFLHTGSGHMFSFGGGQYGQLGCGEVKVSECIGRLSPFCTEQVQSFSLAVWPPLSSPSFCLV